MLFHKRASLRTSRSLANREKALAEMSQTFSEK
jgi:hypothetical protein